MSRPTPTARAEPRLDEADINQLVYLGLGSNLEDRDAHLRQALAALEPHITVVRLSSVYDTAPVLVADQPRFHNVVCGVETALDPMALLRLAKHIEVTLGRVPGPRYGPRVIDIDILLYGQIVLEVPELTIPHPRLAERAFVLVPLAEIAPSLRHPVLGITIAELAAAVCEQDVQAIGPLFSIGC